jgi:hypothetical protein
MFAFDHLTSFAREVLLTNQFRFHWSGNVFRHWLYYLALEPYVRRYWPNVLIAWTRATDGRLRDPLIGRELLVGCAVGVAVTIAIAGIDAVTSIRFAKNLNANSAIHLAAPVLSTLHQAPAWAVWFLVQLFAFRLLLRDTRLAVVAFTAVWLGLALSGDKPHNDLWTVLIFFPAFSLVITRLGLLGGTAFCFAWIMLTSILVTSDLTTGYGNGTLVALGSVAAVGLYGFYTSTLAGRRSPVAIT